MQTSSKRDLGRRSRYYHGMIDLNHLEKGEKYSKLPTSFVIFICTFDYFRAGLPIYRFENRCEKQPSLLLGDDAVTIFVNLTADFSGLSEETMVLLRYMTGQEPEDAFTEACEAIIRKARENTAWEVEYMQWHANEMDMADDLDEARAEGIAEGIEQGKTIIVVLLKEIADRLREGETEDRLKECYDPELVKAAQDIIGR